MGQIPCSASPIQGITSPLRLPITDSEPIAEMKKTDLLRNLVIKHGLLQSLSQGTYWYLASVFRKPPVQAGSWRLRQAWDGVEVGWGVSGSWALYLCLSHISFQRPFATVTLNSETQVTKEVHVKNSCTVQ